jgi:Lrp/AsnC family transcriptional regulator for asnA, asnC and gidA
MERKPDEMDRRIVDLLLEDGRMPSAEMARRLGKVSARTISSRIDRLVERGLMRVTAVCNPRALGYRIAADISIETEPRKVAEVAERLTQLDRVSYVALVAGDRDVAIQVNVADVEDLQTFISDELQAIPGVRRTKTYLLTRILKDIYEWPIPAHLP